MKGRSWSSGELVKEGARRRDRAAIVPPVEFPSPAALEAPLASRELALVAVSALEVALKRAGLRVWVYDNADVDLRLVDDGARLTIAIASRSLRGFALLHGEPL